MAFLKRGERDSQNKGERGTIHKDNTSIHVDIHKVELKVKLQYIQMRILTRLSYPYCNKYIQLALREGQFHAMTCLYLL